MRQPANTHKSLESCSVRFPLIIPINGDVYTRNLEATTPLEQLKEDIFAEIAGKQNVTRKMTFETAVLIQWRHGAPGARAPSFD